MTAQARLTATFPVRQMGLKPDAAIPRHFVADDPFLSAFFAAMSTVFPEGERFFIQSVRHYQPQLDDPQLVAEVRRFIGQEAHHGKEHESFNDWLESKGYPVSSIVNGLVEGLEQARQRLSPKQQLAMTLALEHFTAIMAHQLLTTPAISDAMREEIRELFIWHAVEETEHKAVAYDVYQAVGGDYWTRVLMMLQVSLLFWLHLMQITWTYLKSEDRASLPRMFRGFFWLLGKPGPLRKLLPDYLRYFLPGFHPWQQDNRDLIAPLQKEMEKYVIQAD